MYIYVTYAQTSVAICQEHRQDAEDKGWSYLEYREPDDEMLVDWPCYFRTRTEN